MTSENKAVIDELERIVRRAGTQLGEALYTYWPSGGTSEIAEANQVLQLGRVFGDAGYKVYSEVHRADEINARYDFLAYDPKADIMVVGECKRLYIATLASPR